VGGQDPYCTVESDHVLPCHTGRTGYLRFDQCTGVEMSGKNYTDLYNWNFGEWSSTAARIHWQSKAEDTNAIKTDLEAAHIITDLVKAVMKLDQEELARFDTETAERPKQLAAFQVEEEARRKKEEAEYRNKPNCRGAKKMPFTAGTLDPVRPLDLLMTYTFQGDPTSADPSVQYGDRRRLMVVLNVKDQRCSEDMRNGIKKLLALKQALEDETGGLLQVSHISLFATLPGAQNQLFHPDDDERVCLEPHYVEHPSMSFMMAGFRGARLGMFDGACKVLPLINSVEATTAFLGSGVHESTLRNNSIRMQLRKKLGMTASQEFPKTVVEIKPGQLHAFETRKIHFGIGHTACAEFEALFKQEVKLLRNSTESADAYTALLKYAPLTDINRFIESGIINSRIHIAIHYYTYTGKDTDSVAFLNHHTASMLQK
jgi:hypothetical protein